MKNLKKYILSLGFLGIFLGISPSWAGVCTVSVSGTYTQADLEACAGGTLNGLGVNVGVTLTLDGPISVLGDVTVAGQITHANEDVEGIQIEAANLSIAATGSINANSRGCRGSDGAVFLTGYGPDTSPSSMAYRTCVVGTSGAGMYQYGGAGHGGLGYGSYAPNGAVYDSLISPEFLGSGGGGSASGGGQGGGLIILTVTSVLDNNGSISANAANGGGNQGGGSGGSILINTNTLSGSGTVSASGGNGNSYGGGWGRWTNRCLLRR